MLWWLLAPAPLVVKRADGIYRVGETGEYAIAADGWFAVLALLTGVLLALVAYLRTRPARVGPLVGLVVGGLAGAVLAWQVGALLGPDDLRTVAAGVAVGDRFDGPLDLSAYGVLLAWPIGAVITFFAVAAGAETTAPAPAPPAP